MKAKRKQLILCTAGLLLFVALSALMLYWKQVSDYRTNIQNISYSEVNLQEIADGSYIGGYDAGLVCAKVEVTVTGGSISNIKILEHKNERGSAAEPILNRILAEQKIDVDAVTGATSSSKVLKKAVENALTRPLSQTP